MPRVVIVIQAVPVVWADKAFLASEPDLYACMEIVAARHARDEDERKSAVN